MFNLDSLKLGDKVQVGQETFEVAGLDFPFGYVNPTMKVRALTLHLKDAGFNGPTMTAEDIRGTDEQRKGLLNDHVPAPGETDPTKNPNLKDEKGPKSDFNFDNKTAKSEEPAPKKTP